MTQGATLPQPGRESRRKCRRRGNPYAWISGARRRIGELGSGGTIVGPQGKDLCRCLFANLNTRIGCRKAPGCERIRVLSVQRRLLVGQKMDERIVSGRYDGGFHRCPRSRTHLYTTIRLRVSGEGIHRVKDGYVNDRCPARLNETAGSGRADRLNACWHSTPGPDQWQVAAPERILQAKTTQPVKRKLKPAGKWVDSWFPLRAYARLLPAGRAFRISSDFPLKTLPSLIV